MESARKLIAAIALKLRVLPLVHKPIYWIWHTLAHACREGMLEFVRQLTSKSERFGPIHSVFSVYQALRSGDPATEGRIVLADQGCPEISKDSLLVVGGYHQHHEQPWPIFWSRHSDAHLISESLALRGAPKTICLESVYGFTRLRDEPAFQLLHMPPAVELKGNWTSIISRWVPARDKFGSYPNYTHWMLDALPRLALLPEFPADTRILIPARLHPNQLESLKCLGVLDRCRPTHERHLKLENYYFSAPTTMLQGYNPYGIRFLRESLLPKRDRSTPTHRKIYIKRVGLSREPQNRVALEKLFEDLGWTILDVLQLSFAQQVQVFSEADAVAGMFGSGFTNCVFCKPDCHVLAIMPVEFGLDSYLDWIGQVVGYHWHPVIIPAGYNHRFSVDLKLIQERLAALKLD